MSDVRGTLLPDDCPAEKRASQERLRDWLDALPTSALALSDL